MCEAYTSKTVNWTGQVIHNLGGRKYITDYGVTLSLDINGSIGIYLKGILGHSERLLDLTFGSSEP